MKNSKKQKKANIFPKDRYKIFMVHTSNPLIENTNSAEGTSAGDTSAKGTSAERNIKNLLKLTSVKIKCRWLLSIQRKSMLSFSAARAAKFLCLLIFVFDLDLFVENSVMK